MIEDFDKLAKESEMLFAMFSALIFITLQKSERFDEYR